VTMMVSQKQPLLLSYFNYEKVLTATVHGTSGPVDIYFSTYHQLSKRGDNDDWLKNLPSETLNNDKISLEDGVKYAFRKDIDFTGWGMEREILVLIVPKQTTVVTFMLNKPRSPVLIRQGRVWSDSLEAGVSQAYHFWSKRDISKAELRVH
jgi:hypothetical protein